MGLLRNMLKKKENPRVEDVVAMAQIYSDFLALDPNTASYQERSEVGNQFIDEALYMMREYPDDLKKVLIEQSSIRPVTKQCIHPVLGEINQNLSGRHILDKHVNYVSNELMVEKKQIQYKAIIDQKMQNLTSIPIDIQEKEMTPLSVEEMPEIKISPIGVKFDRVGKLSHYVILIAAMGGSLQEGYFIKEIAALQVVDDTIKEAFHTKLSKDGIEYPTLAQIQDSLLNFIGISPIVGIHLSLLIKQLYKEGIILIKDHKFYDVGFFAKRKYPKIDVTNIKEVVQQFHIPYEKTNTLKDCVYLFIIFNQLLDLIVEQKEKIS